MREVEVGDVRDLLGDVYLVDAIEGGKCFVRFFKTGVAEVWEDYSTAKYDTLIGRNFKWNCQ